MGLAEAGRSRPRSAEATGLSGDPRPSGCPPSRPLVPQPGLWDALLGCPLATGGRSGSVWASPPLELAQWIASSSHFEKHSWRHPVASALGSWPFFLERQDDTQETETEEDRFAGGPQTGRGRP